MTTPDRLDELELRQNGAVVERRSLGQFVRFPWRRSIEDFCVVRCRCCRGCACRPPRAEHVRPLDTHTLIHDIMRDCVVDIAGNRRAALAGWQILDAGQPRGAERFREVLDCPVARSFDGGFPAKRSSISTVGVVSSYSARHSGRMVRARMRPAPEWVSVPGMGLALPVNR